MRSSVPVLGILSFGNLHMQIENAIEILQPILFGIIIGHTCTCSFYLFGYNVAFNNFSVI